MTNRIHLTQIAQSGATSGSVLSWNGSAWVPSVSNITDTATSERLVITDNQITAKAHIIPDLDNTYDLGSATHRWRDIYVSANTIRLGDTTVLSGTSIVVDGGPSPDSLSDIPTVQASKIVAKPFTYNPGAGPITVRPSIEFQVGLNSYPISLNTETFEFSLDAEGNYGTGSLVADSSNPMLFEKRILKSVTGFQAFRPRSSIS